MTKSYAEGIIEYYRPYQESINKARESMYKFQRQFDFQEIDDVTIRCTNAIMRTARYLNEHNINYKDESIDNPERTLMIAVESYMFSKYLEAQKYLNSYINSINKESDEIVKSKRYKVYMKTYKPISKVKVELYKALRFMLVPHNMISGLLDIKNLDVRSNYKEHQHYLTSYQNVCEEVAKFDIEKDIYEAIKVYLPILYSNLKKISISNDPIKDIELRNKLFGIQMNRIVLTLQKLNLLEHITEISSWGEEIMLNDLRSLDFNSILGISNEQANEIIDDNRKELVKQKR